MDQRGTIDPPFCRPGFSGYASDRPALRGTGIAPAVASLGECPVTTSVPGLAVLLTLCVASAGALAAESAVEIAAAPAEPFAFADFTWLTGNARTKESPLSTAAFTGELRVDVDWVHD